MTVYHLIIWMSHKLFDNSPVVGLQRITCLIISLSQQALQLKVGWDCFVYHFIFSA